MNSSAFTEVNHRNKCFRNIHIYLKADLIYFWRGYLFSKDFWIISNFRISWYQMVGSGMEQF